MQYSQTDLTKLIQTVEKEFTVHLAKAEELAKAEDGGEKKEKKPSPEKKEAAPEAPEAEAEAETEAEGEMPPQAEGEGEAAPAGDDGLVPEPHAGAHGYDEEDLAHMDKMYASMSRDELMAHHDSVKKALDALEGAAPAPEMAAVTAPAPAPEMGKSEKPHMSELKNENKLNPKPKVKGDNMNGDAKNGGIEGQKPSGPVGARSPASTDSKNLKDAMAKTERQDRNGGKIDKTAGPKGSPGAKSPASTDQGNLSDMEKSENTEVDLLKSENEDLKKSLDTVKEFLTKLVAKVPPAKAITSLDAITKSEGFQSGEQLTKSEIDSILMKKASDPTLAKSDREAINAFYLSKTDINTISHLLKN